MPQLTVVIVNWNVRDLLRTCLESLARQLPLPEEEGTSIIVVDNASIDGSVEMLRAEFPHVRLIANDHNAGFGAANNQALQDSDSKYLLFLNPDAEVRPGAIQRLLAFIDQRPQVACVGPKLLNPDGSTQPSRRGFPTVATAFVESTMLQRYLGWLPNVRRFYRAELTEDEPQQVD
jgi:N-acetylglucosaminyl-diphospho-decaprenol L-rhamnosyltransferase